MRVPSLFAKRNERRIFTRSFETVGSVTHIVFRRLKDAPVHAWRLRFVFEVLRCSGPARVHFAFAYPSIFPGETHGCVASVCATERSSAARAEDTKKNVDNFTWNSLFRGAVTGAVLEQV